MTEECYHPDDFERLLDLPADHADRRHLATCSSCQTQLDLYRSFISRDNVPAGADLAEANERLGEFLAREIGGDKAAAGPGSVLTTHRWDLRRWSPVLVAACLVGFAIFVNSGDSRRVVAPTGVVRDMSTASAALVTSASATTDGFALSWHGPADAERYEVVVLDAAMVEIDRFAVDHTDEYRLRRAENPWLQSSGPFLWYVVALRGGDETSRSTVRALEPGP